MGSTLLGIMLPRLTCLGCGDDERTAVVEFGVPHE